MKNSFLLVASVLIILGSCNNKTDNKPAQSTPPTVQNTPPPAAEKGSYNPKVQVQADPQDSYALYVPTNADSNSLLLLLFDPGAKGEKPVEKYKALAERHNIILAGSNNSMNGLQGQQSVGITKRLLIDLKTRFPQVKHTNIYASGFSGGGRVAVLAAISENLSGAIGCGAGFPGKPEMKYNFYYVGVVGNKDFNYVEMKRLYNTLDQLQMRHQLIVYDGEHEWSPEEQMEKAILLMRNDAQSRIMIAAKIDSTIAVFKEKKDWTRLYDELRMGITSGLDDTHVKAWDAELKALKKNQACIAELKKEAEIESKEEQKQLEIRKTFPVKDFTALNNYIKTFSQEAGKSSLQKLSDIRLLQFMSLSGFLYSEKALKGDDLTLPKKYLDIYGKADPDNHDYFFLMACYYTKAGDKAAAMTSLKKAAELGFDDENKILNSSMLAPLQSEPGFAEVMKKVGEN